MVKQERWFRIGDLEKLTGTPRRTIHFYVQSGLLHRPVKTGKTMAYYDEAHRQKLAYIQKTKDQGLPLIAIRHKIQERENEGQGFGPRVTTPPQLRKKMPPVRQKNPRKAQGKRTRERILEESSRLFRKQGYKETTIGDITRRLNIGKGSFYFYFSDKKELFLECVPQIFQDLFSKGWEPIRRESHPQERLVLRARAVLPVVREFCTILQLSKEALKEDDPKLKGLGEQIFLSVCRPVEADIEKGIQQGVFRELDPKIVSALMVGILESLDYLLALDPQFPVESFVDQAVNLIGIGLSSEIKSFRPD